MASENTILTALGLDAEGFQSGMSRATDSTNLFVKGLSSANVLLMNIPVVGLALAVVFEQMASGFAQSREEAREFARIMNTDVTGSLEGTIRQIDDINGALQKSREPSFGRFLSDKLINAHRGAENILSFGGLNRGSIEEERASNETNLNLRRAGLQLKAVDLYKQEAKARSEIYAQSTRESAQARIQLDLANRKVAAEDEATRLGGPDRARWSTITKDNLKKELDLAEDIAESETRSADARRGALLIELDYAKEVSRLQVQGNEREIAAANTKRALQQVGNAAYGTDEQKKQAAAALVVAKNAEVAANIQYEFAKRNLQIQTEVMELEVTGQTRAANQAKIRAQYETQITEQEKSGNKELAESLRHQQQLASIAEKTREYNLGAHGRAAEIQKERHDAQVARIIESRERNKAVNAAHNKLSDLSKTHMAGPTHMAAPIHMGHTNSAASKAIREVKLTGAEQFQDTVQKLLGNIDRSLSQ